MDTPLSQSALAASTSDTVSTGALPYYDDEINRPGMRAKVEREIVAEMQRHRTDEEKIVERLSSAHTVFSDRPDLREQFELIGQGERSNALEKNRYTLSKPASEQDVEAWNNTLRSAEAQLMHSDVRSANLDLMKKFGANQWRLHNFQQEAFVRAFSQASEQLKTDVSLLNRTRKASQAQAGQQLTRLSKRWADLLNRTLSVELANVIAQGEIEEAEQQLVRLRRRSDDAGQAEA